MIKNKIHYKIFKYKIFNLLKMISKKFLNNSNRSQINKYFAPLQCFLQNKRLKNKNKKQNKTKNKKKKKFSHNNLKIIQIKIK